MPVFRIPLETSPDIYRFRIAIDNVTYNFRVSWNTRDERWLLNVYDINDVQLLSTPLVVNYPLTDLFKLESLPNKPLIFVNLVNNEECEKGDIGAGCVLLVEY